MNIQLQDLTKQFPARGKKARGAVTAVRDLTFEVPDGKLVGLLGPSGCGKSTTLNMICGLETPTAGRIFFGGEDVTALPAGTAGRGHGVPELCPLPPPDGAAEHHLPAGKPERRAETDQSRDAPAARWKPPPLVQIEPLLDRKPKETVRRAAAAGRHCPGAGQGAAGTAAGRAAVPTWTPACACRTREEICKIQKKDRHHPRCSSPTTRRKPMSISDFIVVMRDGVLMQQGAPPAGLRRPRLPVCSQIPGHAAHQRLCRRGEGRHAAAGRAEGAARARARPTAKCGAGVRPEGFVPAAGGPVACAPQPGGGAGPGYQHRLHPSRPGRGHRARHRPAPRSSLPPWTGPSVLPSSRTRCSCSAAGTGSAFGSAAVPPARKGAGRWTAIPKKHGFTCCRRWCCWGCSWSTR